MKGCYDNLTACVLDSPNNLLTITFHKQTEDAYHNIFQFLLSALERGELMQGFSITFCGGKKYHLDFDGAVLSDTNAFFRNCAQYPGLHLLMKQYVRTVMRSSHCYSDTGDAEKMVPSGGYAAFALGFGGPEHFDILRDFIRHYDSEHWAAPRNMMYAWIAKYGFTKSTAPVILDFIMSCDDTECRVSKINHEILQSILDYVDENGREDDIFRIFESISDDIEDFKVQMHNAPASDKPLYQRMLKLLSEDDGFETEVDNTAPSQQHFHYPELLNYGIGENPELVFYVLDTLGRLSHHAGFREIITELQSERNNFVSCNFLCVGEIFMLSLVRKPKVSGAAITIMPAIRQIQISSGEQILLRMSYNGDCDAFLRGLPLAI